MTERDAKRCAAGRWLPLDFDALFGAP